MSSSSSPLPGLFVAILLRANSTQLESSTRERSPRRGYPSAHSGIAAIELLQLPVDAVIAALLPFFGAAGDMRSKGTNFTTLSDELES